MLIRPDIDDEAAAIGHDIVLNARFNLGRVLAAQGRAAEAREMLERAERLRPGHPAVAEALRALER